MIDTNSITINPEAPDEYWVSPSGSDCWCRVGELKQLIQEVERLREENSGLRDQKKELQQLSDEQAGMLRKIRRAATGEDQVADDDTEGLAWIADYISNGPEGDEPMDDATRYVHGSI